MSHYFAWSLMLIFHKKKKKNFFHSSINNQMVFVVILNFHYQNHINIQLIFWPKTVRLLIIFTQIVFIHFWIILYLFAFFILYFKKANCFAMKLPNFLFAIICLTWIFVNNEHVHKQTADMPQSIMFKTKQSFTQ